MINRENKIAVINLGGQFAHLIPNNIRHFGVRADFVAPDSTAEALQDYKGIILSGSPSLAAFNKGEFNREILKLPQPFFGFCFGHQELAKEAGGKVEHTQPQFGKAILKITRQSPIFEDVPDESTVWMSHSDTVVALSGGFEEIGVTSVTSDPTVHRNAAIANEDLKRYGVQFHPEVDHTKFGQKMLENFVFKICGCSPDWNMKTLAQIKKDEIRSFVGDRSVLVLTSGGVDSFVTLELVGQAIGPTQLHSLHIDNGLMRLEESQAVLEMIKSQGFGKNLHFTDAEDRFLNNLASVIDPAKKREIIGRTFVNVFEEEARRITSTDMILGQGTLYTDMVESGKDGSARIKLHHNAHPLIEEKRQQGKLLEPLNDLYKFEVRQLGKELGLPEEIVYRHPFPGPGLAIRLLCSYGRLSSQMPKFNLDEINEYVPKGLKALIMPHLSTGVKADLPSYEAPLLVSGEATHEELTALSTKLNNQIPGINRLVHDLSYEPFSYMAPRFATITKERLNLLRKADKIVMDSLARHGIMRQIWQCPTVFLPISTNTQRGEYVVIRPVLTERAMTVDAAPLPEAVVEDIKEILELPGILGLGIDKTSKPPATIEWE